MNKQTVEMLTKSEMSLVSGGSKFGDLANKAGKLADGANQFAAPTIKKVSEEAREAANEFKKGKEDAKKERDLQDLPEHKDL